MKTEEIFYPEARFGNFTDIDSTIAFFTRLNGLIKISHVVLDVGCGKSTIGKDQVSIRKQLRTIRGKVFKVIGIDVDAEAQSNPFIDEFRLIQGNAWPVESESIDVIVSDSVLEHVEEPERFFSEAHRVLKDGGYLCLRTPNQWSYVAMCARIIPNKHHAKILRIAQNSRTEDSVFPTLYRCNSIPKIRKMMIRHGFYCVVYGYEESPSYLAFSSIVYFLGVLHQRHAPGFLRTSIFAFGKKLPAQ